MQIADLHIHSKYARATSRDCVPDGLDFWARRKGIHLIGTGDFTHPAWRAELADALVEAEEGLYILKRDRIRPGAQPVETAPRFVLSGEISSIYQKNGKVRKVHNLILLPSLEAAQRLSRRLEAIGNLQSDGRPILGLDCRDLLELTLETVPNAIFIPAHIWTPHFSLFGARSGFDTIEACFGDLSNHI
ncbi:MAG TPA: endonuclease Q family protein, partial [Candidatus Flavonifractor merdigallinarum]|nr:endonuclease Q family protein [Candidatus Flavonifractor merdigallinarum]